ncbi:MAG: hypothetical protein KDD82_29610 [Planctomycetes bacterium]|nr:hypothetical protein [Planctomycetota bacterium]
MDASSADLPSIGPYRVLECLGQGGAGAVYRCAGPGGRGVAVKLARLKAPDHALSF